MSEVSYAEFEISLHSGNGAIVDDPHARIATILENVAAKLRAGEGVGKIFDENGNKVGYFQLDLDD